MNRFSHVSRYAVVAAALIAPLLLADGCSQPAYERQAKMAPDPGETLPEWAFDAPYYFRPPPDALPKAASVATADYPTHYYVNRSVFLLERPDNEVLTDRAPRIAVWWTSTSGCVWSRAGFFGLGQTCFPFVGGDDGAYGIRFVGPNIRESLTEETVPHRVYHLDTKPPMVSVRIAPEQTVFYTGDVVVVDWKAVDPAIDAKSARLNICWSWENPDMVELRRPANENEPPRDTPEPPATRLWRPFKSDIALEDVLAYTIPERVEGEAFQFQVRVQDRAGNYGVGYSPVIFVSGMTAWPTTESPGTQPAGIEPAEADAPQ